MIFKDEDGNFKVAWADANLSPYSGYGASGKVLQKTLKKAGVQIVTGKDAEDCSVGIVYAPLVDAVLESLPTPYRIVFSMFEADRWPESWVATCNAANQVWVPSRFCRKSLMESGCESPVYVVPLGVDPKVFYPTKREKRKTFVIGYAGAATERKGFPMLIKAFRDEFSSDEDVVLRIASSSMLSSSLPKDSQVEYAGANLSAGELREFYNGCDILVVPSKGEGFGLTPLEAMACGTAVAVTDFGGWLDYTGDYALKIGVDDLVSCEGYNGSDGKWASPSISSLRYVLRYAFENQAEIKERGELSAEVAKSWSWQESVVRIKSILSGVNPDERVDIETVEVVVWRGSPRMVRTPVGGFVRGVPRELTPEQLARLDANDTRFVRERRYRRKSK